MVFVSAGGAYAGFPYPTTLLLANIFKFLMQVEMVLQFSKLGWFSG